MESKERESRLINAHNGFKETEKLAQKLQASPFRTHAIGSSIIFQGIYYFYKKDTEHAKKEFFRAAEKTTGSLRARSYNGAGYLEFIEGNIIKAEIALLKALESDSKFAYALSNYGYVLLSKNQFKDAIKYFKRNANNDELKASSYRDVLLAQLAIGHAQEEITSETESVTGYYTDVLEESGRRGFSGLLPLKLRQAYQYNEIAEKIYLSKDYYGLEVFALVLLAKAKEAIASLPENEIDERSNILSLKIETLIESTVKNVPENWLKDDNDRGDFFSWARRI